MNPNKWQFRSVDAYANNGYLLDGFCEATPALIESFPYPAGHQERSGFGGYISVVAPCVLIKFGLPDDPDGFTLTGKARVLLSETHFPRDPEQDYREYTLVERNSVKYAHSEPRVKDTILYVSVCYETDTGAWLFDPTYAMESVVIKGEHGVWGDRLFNLMPRYMRKVDVDNNDALARLMGVFGLAFDDVQSLLNTMKHSYDPSLVDAKYLPYIDRLLGWGTNFELSEELRRIETIEAVSLFKAKGSTRALELVMQRTIGWDVEVYLGRDFVLTTNKLSLGSAPADWIEGEADPNATTSPSEQNTGIWGNTARTFATWSDRDSVPINSTNSTIMLLPSTNGWKNINGVLVRLIEGTGARVSITNTVVKKIKNLLTLFVPSYADVYFVITSQTNESVLLRLEDLSNIVQDDNDLVQLKLSFAETTTAAAPVYVFKSNESPMNDKSYRLAHSGLSYTL